MNREEWLNQVADRMAPWYGDQGYSLPRFRIAIGFPSTGKRGKRIGELGWSRIGRWHLRGFD
jgi:hypothetical protein